MTKRVRESLWEPEWEGPVENWAKSFIRKNQWRCDRIHSSHDLLQDAFIIFMRIKRRYPRVIDPANFMALFKIALRNELHDKAAYMKRKRVLMQDTSCDPVELLAGRISNLSEAAYVKLLLDDAPTTLRRALELLTEHPEALKSQRGKKENLNAKLRRLLDLEEGFDFINGLKSLLS